MWELDEFWDGLSLAFNRSNCKQVNKRENWVNCPGISNQRDSDISSIGVDENRIDSILIVILSYQVESDIG